MEKKLCEALPTLVRDARPLETEDFLFLIEEHIRGCEVCKAWDHEDKDRFQSILEGLRRNSPILPGNPKKNN